jgi:hypothetical protein
MHVWCIVIGIGTAFTLPMHARPPDGPPLVPGSDESEVPARAFVTKACLRTVGKTPTMMKAQFGNPALDYSKRWGNVWRVDFSLPGLSGEHSINRIVCWLPPRQTWLMQIAIGQDIPLLHP